MSKRIEHIFDDNGIELKRCSTCHEYLPLENFNPNKTKWDGLHNMCKSCDSQYSCKRAKENPERANEDNKRSRKNNLEQYQEQARVYCTNRRANDFEFKNKQDIRSATTAVIKSGKLIPRENCEICRIDGPLKKHHEAYDEAHILDVVFLCEECHRMIHDD